MEVWKLIEIQSQCCLNYVLKVFEVLGEFEYSEIQFSVVWNFCMLKDQKGCSQYRQKWRGWMKEKKYRKIYIFHVSGRIWFFLLVVVKTWNHEFEVHEEKWKKEREKSSRWSEKEWTMPRNNVELSWINFTQCQKSEMVFLASKDGRNVMSEMYRIERRDFWSREHSKEFNKSLMVNRILIKIYTTDKIYIVKKFEGERVRRKLILKVLTFILIKLENGLIEIYIIPYRMVGIIACEFGKFTTTLMTQNIATRFSV